MNSKDVSQRGHAVVIGAGIVGVCCALELLQDGWRVTLLEPGEPGVITPEDDVLDTSYENRKG